MNNFLINFSMQNLCCDPHKKPSMFTFCLYCRERAVPNVCGACG